MLTRERFDALVSRAAQGSISREERDLLEPYRVKNAVIMAAGLSSRFAPLSYEKPKGLLRVRGEVLIERQIHQLRQAGIRDITVVTGYKQEMYGYLEQEGVHLIYNPDYSRYNNTGTLMYVLDRLDNTYLCSSDDYFAENVFSPYEYEAYYAGLYTDEPTEEYCMQTDSTGRITGVTIGGGPGSWYMLGHVYFSRAYAQEFSRLLREHFPRQKHVREGLWEKFYMEHLDALDMKLRTYGPGIIYEFDALEELQEFDEAYRGPGKSRILDEIGRRLDCSVAEIRQIRPVHNTDVPLAFRFAVNGKAYLYRHGPQDFGEITPITERKPEHDPV